ncbi:MAG: extracellular solute-binding protein [Deltaproteobacteria bacterium]|nr:extracellular solute-binding protein [Deltaproteobacteria bacterium]
MRVVALVLFTLLLFPSPARAQTRKPSLNELVSYMGADREQLLYAGAKAQGRLMWYTSLAGGSYKALITAFEAKYPGVKVDVYRAGGSDLFVRMTEEYKAGRYLVDTIETTEGNLMFMRDSRLLQPYNSPLLRAYSDDAKEPAGKGLYYWALARESYIGFAYNKNLLPAAAVPKNFDGLLHPDLKGKMGLPLGGTSGSKIVGAIIKAKGEELVKKLKEQQIKLYNLDAPALVNVIASGEVTASPAIFQSHTWLAASKGAPVEWLPMDLVPNNVGSAAIAVKSPRPHGAVLMADFLLSPDGQKILEKFQYGSATKEQPFKRWRPEHGITTEKYEKEVEHWEKLIKQIGFK